MKIIAQMFCLALFGVSLAVWAGDDIRWTEEVKLSDGRIIQIQRRVELTDSAFPVGRRGFRRYIEICYEPMKLHWKSKGAYVPDIFDIVDGKAYIHVPIGACAECRAHGDPDPNALYFVFENGQWKRIRYAEFPQASEWNLLMSIVSAYGREKNDPHGLVTLEDKVRRPSSLRFEQKRTGWKRVNESYAWQNACKKCGRDQANTGFTDAQEIFISDDSSWCGM